MQNIKVVNTIEYISEDILEENFIRAFKHMHCMQVFLGSCRVNAKDRFVTKPSYIQKFYTLILIISAFALSYTATQIYFSKFKDYKSIYYIRLSSLLLENLKFICIIVHVRFINGQANANFLIKLQKTDRLMKIDQNETINEILYRINFATVVLLIVYFVFLAVVSVSSGNFIHLTLMGLAYSQHVFLLEMTHCMNLVMYYFLRIRFINSILKNHLSPPKENLAKSFSFSKKAMRSLAYKTHDFTTSDTDLYLRALFDSFFKFQKLYRFQVIYIN